MEKALLIYNPVSGRRQLRYSLDKIINILSHKYEVVVRETHKAGDGTLIVKENCKKQYAAIICCGGDGTLNEVVNGVVSCITNVSLGYIPCGSTNDFAQSLRIPTNFIAAANNILHAETVPVDVGLFDNRRHFSYIASFGAFTAASYDTPQNMKNSLGHLAYIIRGAKDFFALKKSPVYDMEISFADGVAVRGEYFFGAVCNSTSVGGLIRLPENTVDFGDGLFECVFIKKPKKRKEWFALLDDILHQRIEKNPLVCMRKTAGVTIKTKESIDWTLDGERVVAGEKITVKVQPRAIKLFV